MNDEAPPLIPAYGDTVGFSSLRPFDSSRRSPLRSITFSLAGHTASPNLTRTAGFSRARRLLKQGRLRREVQLRLQSFRSSEFYPELRRRSEALVDLLEMDHGKTRFLSRTSRERLLSAIASILSGAPSSPETLLAKLTAALNPLPLATHVPSISTWPFSKKPAPRLDRRFLPNPPLAQR